MDLFEQLDSRDDDLSWVDRLLAPDDDSPDDRPRTRAGADAEPAMDGDDGPRADAPPRPRTARGSSTRRDGHGVGEDTEPIPLSPETADRPEAMSGTPGDRDSTDRDARAARTEGRDRFRWRLAAVPAVVLALSVAAGVAGTAVATSSARGQAADMVAELADADARARTLAGQVDAGMLDDPSLLDDLQARIGANGTLLDTDTSTLGLSDARTLARTAGDAADETDDLVGRVTASRDAADLARARDPVVAQAGDAGRAADEAGRDEWTADAVDAIRALAEEADRLAVDDGADPEDWTDLGSRISDAVAALDQAVADRQAARDAQLAQEQRESQSGNGSGSPGTSASGGSGGTTSGGSGGSSTGGSGAGATAPAPAPSGSDGGSSGWYVPAPDTGLPGTDPSL